MNTNVVIKPKFGDLSDAAVRSGYKKRQLYQFIREGKIRAYRPGSGKLLIDLDELDAFIRSKPYDAKTRIDKIVDEVIREVGK